jgi:intein-encoded DNA endonuclease-like protein
MKVSVKDFQITMDLGNNGIELEVYDAQNNHLGDLRMGKATIEWCKGKIRAGNGIKVSWEELIDWFQSEHPH